MSKKQQPPADDQSGEVAFRTINSEIDRLLKRLAAKGVCPSCLATGLMYRGAFLHAEVAGTEETVSLCLDIADVIEDPSDGGMLESQTQH